MAKVENEFGVVGLGRMGGGLAILKEVSSLAGFRDALQPARAVFI